MRPAFLLSPIALLSVVACAGTTAGLGPAGPLAGSWETVPHAPSGGVDLSLGTAGPIITGTGFEDEGPYAFALTITGQQRSDGTFRLVLTSSNLGVATYAGHMVGANELEGEWTPAGATPDGLVHSYPRTFGRR